MTWDTIKEKVLDHYATNGVVYLANAFSLNMLGSFPSRIEVYGIPISEWHSIAREIEGYGIMFDCAIGHDSTVRVYNSLFGARFDAQRKVVKIEKGVIVVFQLRERLPEGAVLAEEEVQSMVEEGKVGIYLVLVNL